MQKGFGLDCKQEVRGLHNLPVKILCTSSQGVQSVLGWDCITPAVLGSFVVFKGRRKLLGDASAPSLSPLHTVARLVCGGRH